MEPTALAGAPPRKTLRSGLGLSLEQRPSGICGTGLVRADLSLIATALHLKDNFEQRIANWLRLSIMPRKAIKECVLDAVGKLHDELTMHESAGLSFLAVACQF